MRAKTQERAEARRMRQDDGASLQTIVAALGVSKSSVSAWVRDIELTAEQQDLLAARNVTVNQALASRVGQRIFARKKRMAWQEEGRMAAQQGEPLHVMGCMLYWGEGSKKRNVVGLTNSSPALLSTFISFLRHYFDVDDEDCALYLSFYTDNGLTQHEIESHWLQVLDLPTSCLRKPVTDRRPRSGITINRRLPYGMCNLYLGRVDVVQHIYGAIQEYSGVDDPALVDIPG